MFAHFNRLWASVPTTLFAVFRALKFDEGRLVQGCRHWQILCRGSGGGGGGNLATD